MRPEQMRKLVELIDADVISGKIAKTVLVEMLATGKDPEQVVKEKGLSQLTNEDELRAVIRGILAQNPSQVEDYRAGKTKVVGFLVGQAMKATGGRAKPDMLNRLMTEELGAPVS